MTFEKHFLNSSLNFQHLGPSKHISQELILLAFLCIPYLKKNLWGREVMEPQVAKPFFFGTGREFVPVGYVGWLYSGHCLGERRLEEQCCPLWVWSFNLLPTFRKNETANSRSGTEKEKVQIFKYLCFHKRVNLPSYPRDRYFHHTPFHSNKFLRCQLNTIHWKCVYHHSDSNPHISQELELANQKKYVSSRGTPSLQEFVLDLRKTYTNEIGGENKE